MRGRALSILITDDPGRVATCYLAILSTPGTGCWKTILQRTIPLCTADCTPYILLQACYTPNRGKQSDKLSAVAQNVLSLGTSASCCHLSNCKQPLNNTISPHSSLFDFFPSSSSLRLLFFDFLSAASSFLSFGFFASPNSLCFVFFETQVLVTATVSFSVS